MYKVTISPPFSTCDAGRSWKCKLSLLFASQWPLSTQAPFCLLLSPQPPSHFLSPQGPWLLQLSSASSAQCPPPSRAAGSTGGGLQACGIVGRGGKAETAEGGGEPWHHASHRTQSPWVISNYDHTCDRCSAHSLRPSPG